MGPQDVNGYSLGGTRKATLSTEVLFPFPGLRDNKAVRMSWFADSGTIWGESGTVNSASSDFRYSTGLALTWLSPIGPMKFSYALPLNTKPGDNLQRFQFQLGTVF